MPFLLLIEYTQLSWEGWGGVWHLGLGFLEREEGCFLLASSGTGSGGRATGGKGP